ncbi:MAG TPA: hypothetical protein PLO05_05770 [Bacteroidales bacterium]|jgi:hypothetical protein|nr:hypothetical protein [Bacteroidales bacterium]MDD4234731.1 hypothetical protein [Bacteroidales bacterium]HXK81645.1 hypothetical protein [Bacteroidales bacterium]
MAKLSNVQKGLVLRVEQATDNDMLDIIKDIEERGGEFIIEPLISKYFKSTSELIKKQIISLFCRFKDNSVAEAWLKALQNYIDEPEVFKLLSATWQSSIDFSACINEFLVFIENGDVQTSLEAITGIQENISLVENENLELLKSNLTKLNLSEPMIQILVSDIIDSI